MPNPDINQEAAAFIDWAMKELQDPATYETIVREVQQQAADFYRQPQTKVLALLEPKLIRGAKEHGDPYYDREILEQEITFEYIDLLGWLLIKKWNTRGHHE